MTRRGLISLEGLFIAVFLLTFILATFGVWQMHASTARTQVETHTSILRDLTGADGPLPVVRRPSPVRFELGWHGPGLSLDGLPNQQVRAEEELDTYMHAGIYGQLDVPGIEVQATGLRAPWAWSSGPAAPTQERPEATAVRAWYERLENQAIGAYRFSLLLAD